MIEVNALANIVTEIDLALLMGRPVRLDVIRAEAMHGIAYLTQFSECSFKPPKDYGSMKRSRESQVVAEVERIS